MRRNAFLVGAGGILAALAFFLPYFSGSRTGVFSSGPSLLNFLQQVFAPPSGLTSRILLSIVVIYLPEPLGTLLLLVGGVLVLTRVRTAYLWSLSGAVIGLTFLLWDFTFLQAAFAEASTEQGIASFETVISGYGTGYWLAVIGCAVGLVSAALGWQAHPTRTTTTAKPPGGRPPGRALRVRPETVLVFCGGGIIAIGFFIGPFLNVHYAQESPFALSQEPHQAFLFWPDVLAPLLLLAGGVGELRGKQGAYLVCWSGALVCLTFLWEFFALYGGFTLPFPVGTGSLLTLLGVLLGGAGAVLGLRARPATPSTAGALVPPTSP